MHTLPHADARTVKSTTPSGKGTAVAALSLIFSLFSLGCEYCAICNIVPGGWRIAALILALILNILAIGSAFLAFRHTPSRKGKFLAVFVVVVGIANFLLSIFVIYMIYLMVFFLGFPLW